MSELDQISRSIGGLEANISTLIRQQSDILTRLDRQNEDVIEQRGAVNLLATQHAALSNQMEKEVLPTVQDYKAVKNRGIGAVLALGITGGGIAAGIIEALRGMFTGGGGPHAS